MKVKRSKYKLYHRFHMVEPSILPFLLAVFLGIFLFNFVQLFLSTRPPFNSSFYFAALYVSLVGLLTVVAGGFYSIRQESTVWGKHNDKVRKGLRLGFYLFIVSEVFFFVAIFWTFIYNGVNAHCDGIGHQGPSFGITTMSGRGVPGGESALLFCSAYTSNYAKNALKNKQNFEDTADYLLVTIVLGVLFLVAQVGEYINYKYSMADSVFGSIFYFGTGFHGSHVLIGVVFLIVMYIRLYNNDFSTKKFMGLELAIIYGHFVDAIGVGLLAVFYGWGGSIRISGNRSALVGDDGCTYLPNGDCVSFYLESLYE